MFLGGNSVKATSGINGAGTYSQLQANITTDNPELFYQDIVASAMGIFVTVEYILPLPKSHLNI